jgi:dihydroorotate dehydrogenase electron transfer subunit
MHSESIADRRGAVLSILGYDERLFSIRLEWDFEGDVIPGQFVLLRFPDRMDPLLGRPLAIAESEPGRIRLLFRIVGRMTRELSLLQAGTVLSIRGPVGNGFPMDSGRKRIFVAGTTGFASILSAYRGTPAGLRAGIILGVPDVSWQAFADAMSGEIPSLAVFSQDGHFGRSGTALDGLPDVLPRDTDVWACGPRGMLAALVKKYPDRAGDILVSMEQRMACGMGGCLGCAVPTRNGRKRVCVDGPVFRAGEVEWDVPRDED